jgi:hypothetical protein
MSRMLCCSLNLYRDGAARMLGLSLAESMFVCSVGVFHVHRECIEPFARLAVFQTRSGKYEDNGNVSISDQERECDRTVLG